MATSKTKPRKKAKRKGSTAKSSVKAAASSRSIPKGSALASTALKTTTFPPSFASYRVHVFLSPNGAVTLWQKAYLWHQYMAETPRPYADAMARVLNKRPDYGPCFWGMHEESPEEHGYRFAGVIAFSGKCSCEYCKSDTACCDNESRTIEGGCCYCGDPCI